MILPNHILAIDPGTEKSAVLQWDGETVGGKLIMNNHAILPLLDATECPIAIEMIASYGMPVGCETFETVLWIGRFMERAKTPVRLVYRRDIKLHLCNSARAKDANVRQALIDRFGKPGIKKSPGVTYGITSHLWAAFAIAVYAHDCPDRAFLGEVEG